MLRFLPLFTRVVFGTIETETRPVLYAAESSFDVVQDYGSILARSIAHFFITNSTETIPGLIELDLDPMTTVTAVDGLEGYEVDRVSVGDSQFDFRSWLPRLPSTFLDRTRIMGIGPRSTFATRAGSFLYSPVNSTNAQIVVAPSNASEYAYEGKVYYARNLGYNSWSLHVSVGIVGHYFANSTPRRCFVVSHSLLLGIPSEVFGLVFTRFQQLGIDVSLDDGGISFSIRSEIDESLIDDLPILQFVLPNVNGIRINVVQVHPREYMRYDSGYPRPQYPRVMLRSFGSDSCFIASTFLRKTLIHFDAVNNRVGFGDPLNDF